MRNRGPGDHIGLTDVSKDETIWVECLLKRCDFTKAFPYPLYGGQAQAMAKAQAVFALHYQTHVDEKKRGTWK